GQHGIADRSQTDYEQLTNSGPVPAGRREWLCRLAFKSVPQTEMASARRRLNYLSQAVHLRLSLRRSTSPEYHHESDKHACSRRISMRCRQVSAQLWRDKPGKPEFRVVVR